MSMGDTLMTVVAIFLAVILMFLFPMLSVSERTDDISQLAVETAVSNFVDDSRAIGKITVQNYEELVNALNATGNSYDIELEHKVLDENIGKKISLAKAERKAYAKVRNQLIKRMNKIADAFDIAVAFVDKAYEVIDHNDKYLEQWD